MIVVDASVWVSWLRPADRHHQATRGWLEPRLLAGEVMATPDLAIIEVAGAIARITGQPSLGRRSAAGLIDIPLLEVHSGDKERFSLAIALAADCRLRGADAVYAALAMRLDATLVTWDAELLDRASSRVRTERPAV